MEKSFIPPSLTRPRPIRQSLIDAVKDQLSLSTLLLIGATLQTVLFLLPLRPVYALVPATFLLVARGVQTMLITYNVLPNPYITNSIQKKYTAQVMDKDGNFPGPGKEKVAIFLLGFKINHPLGIFAPDVAEVGKYANRMYQELDNAPTQESGFLGSTGFSRKDENGATQLMTISYWRTAEDVHRYAHSPKHLETWKWWEATVIRKHKANHIGIMHEVFEAPAGLWESVYVNFEPTLLANTTYLKKDGKMVGGEVKEEWISPILDASKGRLNTSNKRRGLGDSAAVEKMFEGSIYAKE